jgi:hypothetical protein
MKKMEKLALGLTIAMLGLLACTEIFINTAKADTGWQSATRKALGSYINVRLVTLSSTTGTALFDATHLRPDGMCRVNDANTVWIGTVAATVNSEEHYNIVNGFPILSSETFKLNGSMTGAIYGTCGTGVSSCELRCIDGLSRQ